MRDAAVIDVLWEDGYRAHVRDMALEHDLPLMWFTKTDMLVAAERTRTAAEFVDAMERALADRLHAARYWWPWTLLPEWRV